MWNSNTGVMKFKSAENILIESLDKMDENY